VKAYLIKSNLMSRSFHWLPFSVCNGAPKPFKGTEVIMFQPVVAPDNLDNVNGYCHQIPGQLLIPKKYPSEVLSISGQLVG